MSKRIWSILTLVLVLGFSLITGNPVMGAEAALNAAAPPPSSESPLYLSVKDGGTFGANSLAVEDEDVISFDGADFHMHFDGSDMGLAALEIDAMNILSDTEVLMSFSKNTSCPAWAQWKTPTW